MTANRSCRGGAFAGNLKLAGEQVLQALIIHDQHQQIHALDTGLQASAAAANGNECWSAPTAGRAASRNSFSMLTAKDETGFKQVWNYDHALGVFQHLFRYTAIRSSHDRL